MNDNLVKRLKIRLEAWLEFEAEDDAKIDKEVIARIEQLEAALHRIEENEDQFSMQWAAEIARAALKGETE
jgi:hypothetical protein